jgi:hypothetical protein
MYVVHHPIESLGARDVDIILENGLKWFDELGNSVEYQKSKSLSGLVVDTTSYVLMVKEFIARRKKSLNHVDMLSEFFTLHKYALLQSRNCCIVLVSDGKSFHLFDAYGELDSADANAIDGPKASWIRFNQLDGALHYLETRMVPSDDGGEVLFKIHFVNVVSYGTVKAAKAGYFLFNSPGIDSEGDQKSCQFSDDAEDESIDWICRTKAIPWSRLETRNMMGSERYLLDTKWKEFDIEIDNKLFSLWGNIHPNMKVFKQHSGRQHLACTIVSLIMAHMYDIDEWDATLLDSVVAHGHKYFVERVADSDKQNYRLKAEDMSGVCTINNFKFDVDVRLVVYGKLYEANKQKFNLKRALDFAFRHKKLHGVVLQCNGRFLAIGHMNNVDFFMFDSQSHGSPLFQPNQGTTYVLKCCCFKILLACIVLTLSETSHNIDFYLYGVAANYSTPSAESRKTKTVTVAEDKEGDKAKVGT